MRVKSLFICSLSLFLLLYSCKDTGNDNLPDVAYYVPAEFETKKAIWLASPTVDFKTGWSMLNVQADMITALWGDIHIHYSINSDSDKEALLNLLQQKGVSIANSEDKISFHTILHGDLWVRDTGGTYMRNKNGEQKVIDFDFDAYRTEPYNSEETNAIYQMDNDVSHLMASALELGIEQSNLVAEGGNFHFNGKGTMLAVEKALVDSNPTMTKAEIIAELKRVFNVSKVILIPRSLPTDAHPVEQAPYFFGETPVFNFGVNHIDEIVTWINPSTIMLPEVSEEHLVNADPITLIANSVLNEAYEILSKETDQDGNPLKIIRSPEPVPIIEELTNQDIMYLTLSELKGIKSFPQGEPIKFALAASYMNYVVGNSVILIPRMYVPGRDIRLQNTDQQFLNIMEQAFPNYTIVQINVDALTVGGGGMHCITQQIPL